MVGILKVWLITGAHLALILMRTARPVSKEQDVSGEHWILLRDACRTGSSG
jgi:hypothetical protein